jgi:hypothetical protein
VLPGEIDSGKTFSFLVGCHSAATSGNLAFRSLKPGSNDLLEQYGQPDPMLVRPLIDDFHSWPHLPSHQTALLLVLAQCSGRALPFLVGCHSEAISE